jgi:hypothetical protein
MGARGLPLARRQRLPMVVLGNFTGWLFGAGGGARRAHSLDARVVQPVEVSMKLNATCATGAYSRLFRDRHIRDSLARAGCLEAECLAGADEVSLGPGRISRRRGAQRHSDEYMVLKVDRY